MEPIFTVDWFTGNVSVWSKVLDEFKGNPVSGLEIGSFQGRSARWLMENILTHPDSTLTCVDTFEGSVKYHDPALVPTLRSLFDYNLKPFESKLEVLVGNSRTVLPTITKKYDFAYVDGDHRSFAVLEDAVHAFRLLKYGGVLIFDDYLWKGDINELDNPKIGIDAFIAANRNRLIILHNDYQLIVRKVANE